ncbi:MAG: hypothetical protein PUE18_10350 [Firmicutes bacterium]|nr:hypothetical protein [Bacillota bacterium]
MAEFYFFVAFILAAIIAIIVYIIKVMLNSREKAKRGKPNWGQIIGCIVALFFLICLAALLISFSIGIQNM